MGTDKETSRWSIVIATWEVRAGLIPGTPMPEYTRQFHYTSENKVADLEKPAGTLTTFNAQMLLAHQYAQNLSNPGNLNWVEVTFIWF